MIQKWKVTTRSLIWIEEKDNSNLKKHVYQNMVVMEATKLVNTMV